MNVTGQDNGSATNASRAEIEAVMHAWEKAFAAHDLEGLLACYAPEATLESPLVAHITGGPGVRRGHDELPRPIQRRVLLSRNGPLVLDIDIVAND